MTGPWNLQRRNLEIERQRAVLMALRDLAQKFGVANDAQDHGSVVEAVRLREEASGGIRRLLMEHDFLKALFPELEQRLDHGLLPGVGWAMLCDRVDALLMASNYLRL